MNLYEIVKTYGKGKGESTMWSAIKTMSDFLDESSLTDSEIESIKRSLYAELSDGHYNEHFANKQMEKMYYTDSVGIKHYAPYWSEDQMKSVYDASRPVIPSDYNLYDFEVAMNMLKSDYYNLLKDWFKDSDEELLDEKVISMTETYLNDEDAPHPKSKIWEYFN